MLVSGYFQAGSIAAFGHELLYWTNIVRRGGREVNFMLLLLLSLSVLYILTGGAIAYYFCQDERFQSYLYALGVGFFWPGVLKALNYAAITVSRTLNKLSQKL